MAKLTKAQREFFSEFARNDISNCLFPLLHSQGLEFTEEVANEVLDGINFDPYIELIAESFLARVDFATIKKIDKVMKSEEFQKVIVASHQVSDVVNDARIAILTALVPDEDEAEVTQE